MAGCARISTATARKFPPNELVERGTGSPMRMQPYLGYLSEKYGALYGLEDR